MSALLALVPAVFFGILAMCGMLTGSMPGRNGWVYKDDDPTQFALSQGVALSICAVLIAWTVAMIW